MPTNILLGFVDIRMETSNGFKMGMGHGYVYVSTRKEKIWLATKPMKIRFDQ